MLTRSHTLDALVDANGNGQYVVVDLVHDAVIDHRQPSGEAYRRVRTLRAGDDVELIAGMRGVSVPVRNLLP